MKKKLLVLVDFESNGGTKSYFLNLLEFIKSFDNNRVIYLKQRSSLSQLDVEKIEKIASIEYLPKYYTQDNLKKFPILFSIFRILFCFSKGVKYDKIIVSTGNYFHFLSFCFFNKNLFYVLHTYPSSVKENFLKKFIKKKLFQFYNLFRFKLITVSDFSKKQILEYTHFNLDKLFVVHNYVNNQNFNRTNLIKNKTVLTIGHIEEWKNPRLWISVAEKICRRRNDIFFIWVGDGSLKDVMKDLTLPSLSDKIKWVGNSNNVSKFYETATIYFQPSIIESFGLAVVEAMSYGLPCVVSKNGGLIEIVEDCFNGLLIDIDNVNDIVEKIEFILDNDFLLSQYSKNALNTQQTNFNISKWTSLMKSIIYE